jgi:hypothetical protein
MVRILIPSRLVLGSIAIGELPRLRLGLQRPVGCLRRVGGALIVAFRLVARARIRIRCHGSPSRSLP